MVASALGGALSGGADLIGAVGSLLPSSSTTKGRTISDQTAKSETDASELSVGGSTSTSTGTKTGTSKTDLSNLISTDQSTTESGSSRQSTKATVSEVFSGQQNKTISQTLLDTPAIQRIMATALQGDGSTPGLQAITSGERNAGLFNSSTNQLLTSDLLTRVSGEAARLGAATVNQESLGSTSNTTSSTSSVKTITDAVSRVLGNTKETGSQTSASSEQSFSQDDVLNFMAQLANSVTNQEAHSDTTTKSKTKSSKCFSTLFFVTALGMADDSPDMEQLRGFRDTYISDNHHETIRDYYINSEKAVNGFYMLSSKDQDQVIKVAKSDYFKPMLKGIKAGDTGSAFGSYIALLEFMDNIKGV